MGLSKEYIAKLEVAVLAAWLLKDFSWVLLIHFLAFPAAVAAISLQFHSMVLEWKVVSDAVNVHALAAFMWILGNAVWMTSEILWDGSSSYDTKAKMSIIPWRQHPLAGENKEAYSIGVRYGQGIFISALSMLLVFYLTSAMRFRSSASAARTSTNPQEDSDQVVAEPLVWGLMTPEVYSVVYIGPWLLKDLFWTFEMLYPGLICSGVVLFLMSDCVRRFGTKSVVVEIFWATANTIWLYGELGLQTPQLAPRLVAGMFLLVGCALTWNVYKQGREKSKAQSSATNSESRLLIGAPCD
jgi:hypothetical protein